MAENTSGRSSSNLTDIEIAYILGLSDAGLSHQDIATQCGRSKSTVTRVTQRYNIKSFTGVEPPPGPRKEVDERQRRTLLREVKQNRRSTLSEITNILSDKLSVRTLQRRLNEAGIQKHIAVQKPWLTSEHMKARLE